MPIFTITIEGCIMNMITGVKEQENVVSKVANIFDLARDESVNINNYPQLAVVAMC